MRKTEDLRRELAQAHEAQVVALAEAVEVEEVQKFEARGLDAAAAPRLLSPLLRLAAPISVLRVFSFRFVFN